MTRREEIYQQLDELINKGDWFEIKQLVKEDATDLTLYTLIQIATEQRETIDRIKSIVNK
jgi:hypothetical protein